MPSVLVITLFPSPPYATATKIPLAYVTAYQYESTGAVRSVQVDPSGLVMMYFEGCQATAT